MSAYKILSSLSNSDRRLTSDFPVSNSLPTVSLSTVGVPCSTFPVVHNTSLSQDRPFFRGQLNLEDSQFDRKNRSKIKKMEQTLL